MNLNFSIRCMMMGRMTDRKGGKKSQGRKRTTCGTPSVLYSLIPGAAMVILEMTTWEMPLTAAFFGTQTEQKSPFKRLLNAGRFGSPG